MTTPVDQLMNHHVSWYSSLAKPIRWPYNITSNSQPEEPLGAVVSMVKPCCSPIINRQPVVTDCKHGSPRMWLNAATARDRGENQFLTATGRWVSPTSISKGQAELRDLPMVDS